MSGHQLEGLPSSFPNQSPISYGPNLNFSGDRTHVGLPPSLWMSSASVASSPGFTEHPYPPLAQLGQSHHQSLSESLADVSGSPSGLSLYGESGRSTAPTSASSPKVRILNDLLTDKLFSHGSPLDDRSSQNFPSPLISGSPDLKPFDIPGYVDPEQLAKEDPLATQVWKMYARTKASLPHAQRMENLTWRMMALALKKKKEEEEKSKIEEQQSPILEQPAERSTGDAVLSPKASVEEKEEDQNERGRSVGKGKARVQVVGFDGANQDGIEDTE